MLAAIAVVVTVFFAVTVVVPTVAVALAVGMKPRLQLSVQFFIVLIFFQSIVILPVKMSLCIGIDIRIRVRTLLNHRLQQQSASVSRNEEKVRYVVWNEYRLSGFQYEILHLLVSFFGSGLHLNRCLSVKTDVDYETAEFLRVYVQSIAQMKFCNFELRTGHNLRRYFVKIVVAV